MPEIKDKKKLITELNKALAWELRAQAMYAHYSAYVQGLDSIHLQGHFKEEAEESFGHAAKVRDMITQLDGEATTNRDAAPIVHTTNTRKMLQEALKTEQAAAAQYEKIMPLVSGHPVFSHDLPHIMLDELRAVVELETLLAR